MGPIERVQAVLAGRRPDRPPVSFWHHFSQDQYHGQPAVDAHVAHVEAFELDFLKVMNDNGYPHAGRIERVEDLKSLSILRGDEPPFSHQLDLLADLKRALGGRLMMTSTLFNAWATLRRLIRPSVGRHRPPDMDASGDAVSGVIREFFVRDRDALKSAIDVIAENLRRFADRCIEAGADGIFMSVRDDWARADDGSTRLYDEIMRPADLRILAGAAGARLNMLHVCGRAVNFDAFAKYPVHAINWADRAAGPSIADACARAKPAICGGVDNLTTLPDGSPEDCEREVRDALRQAGARPIMISAGCTYDPQRVPRENLEAVCRAARR